jgi:hypothetical protein
VAKILQIIGLVRRVPKSWKTIYNFLIGNELADVGKVIGALARIPRNVTTTITTVVKKITQSITQFLNPFGGASGGIMGGGRGMASGGIGGGRQVLVGEQGPELVNLPFGSKVTPAGQTRAALAKGNGEQRVIVEIRSGGSRMDDLLVELLRGAVRSRGGNVQTVLGRGQA